MNRSRRTWLTATAAAAITALLVSRNDSVAEDLPKKRPADRLSGPPEISAKGWAIIEGDSGKLLWGHNQNEPLILASTSKIMTAWLVLDLQKKVPDILQQTPTVSEKAAKTEGSSAKIETGDRVSVGELLYGLLLPSGNDAATALAEHCGPHYRQEGDPESAEGAFVAQMNRQADKWKLAETCYFDPHGLGKNHASPANLAAIAWNVMQSEQFRTYVQTRSYDGELLSVKDEKRKVKWTNTNKLLEIEGYDGIKTGTTTAAGSCLVSSGRRGKDHLIIVMLGSTSSDGRYVDSRNLFRWAWRERGHSDQSAE
jgi:D-alanyl-D-alanine carboxypeptidase (penicillin-binding protein 5/6)